MTDRGPGWWRSWIDLQLEHREACLTLEIDPAPAMPVAEFLETVELRGTNDQLAKALDLTAHERAARLRWVVDEECLSIARRASEVARGGGSLSLRAWIDNGYGSLLVCSGRYEEADRLLRDSLTTARRCEDCSSRRHDLVLPFGRSTQQQVARTKEICDDLQQLLRPQSLPEFSAHVDANLGWIALRRSGSTRRGDSPTAPWAELRRVPDCSQGRWQAALPALILALLDDDIAEASSCARFMLEPSQEALAGEVEPLLREAIERSAGEQNAEPERISRLPWKRRGSSATSSGGDAVGAARALAMSLRALSSPGSPLAPGLLFPPWIVLSAKALQGRQPDVSLLRLERPVVLGLTCRVHDVLLDRYQFARLGILVHDLHKVGGGATLDDLRVNRVDALHFGFESPREPRREVLRGADMDVERGEDADVLAVGGVPQLALPPAVGGVLERVQHHLAVRVRDLRVESHDARGVLDDASSETGPGSDAIARVAHGDFPILFGEGCPRKHPPAGGSTSPSGMVIAIATVGNTTAHARTTARTNASFFTPTPSFGCAPHSARRNVRLQPERGPPNRRNLKGEEDSSDEMSAYRYNRCMLGAPAAAGRDRRPSRTFWGNQTR